LAPNSFAIVLLDAEIAKGMLARFQVAEFVNWGMAIKEGGLPPQ